MKYIYTFVLTAVIILSAGNELFSASSVSTVKVDAASFPDVYAEIFFFNDGYVPESPDKSTVILKENGIPLNINDLTCPGQSPAANVSITIAFDLAANSSGTMSNFTLAQSTAAALIELLEKNTSECALTSFDIFSYLSCDYTSDKNKLLTSVNKLQSRDGSSYDAGFLSEPAGALKIAAMGKYEKSIVVITDGTGYASIDSIINTAKAENIKIFWLKIGGPVIGGLRRIAEETGGFWFDRIDSGEEINAAVNHVLAMAYGYKPCTLRWMNNFNCDSTKTMTVEVPDYPAQTQFSYPAPIEDMPRLELDPPYLGYSAVLPGFTRELDVRMKAVNGDISINEFRIMPPFSVTAGDVPQGEELIIPEGGEHTITIEFAPADSAMVYTVLDIDGNACYGRYVIITGGFPNVAPKQRTLNLDSPLCGETLIIGDTTHVRWSGLLPGDVVQLEYSTDGGMAWDTIVNDITGLEYPWEVPNIPTDSCLVRVVQLWPNNVGETLNFFHKNGVNSARFNKNGDLIITACKDQTARVWNSNTGWLLCEMEGHTANVNWANFDRNYEYAVTASDDKTLKVWKFDNEHTEAELLHTLTGHRNFVRCANFNHDGKKIISAGADGMVIIWDRDSGAAIDTIVDDGFLPQWFVSYSPSGNKIVTAGYAGRAVMYNMTDGSVARVFSTGKNEALTFAAFSPQEDRICATGWFGKGTVWDTQTGDTLFTINHTDSTSYLPAVTSADFNFSGEFLLTSCVNNTARMWNAHNGKLIMPLVEHTGSVQTAMFNFDASRILTASMDSTAKVWNLDKRDLQSDSTDCLISIDSPVIESMDIEFGDILLDEVKDSLVTNFIINKSDFPFNVKKIEISGEHAADFTLKSGFAPYLIDSAGTASAKISFHPRQTGKRNAVIRIIIPLDTIEKKLTGTGIEPGLTLISNYIDFKQVQVGDFKDTTLEMIVQNRSVSNDISIDSIFISGPDMVHFSILEGSGDVMLRPGQSHEMSLRFMPESFERISSGITFEYDAVGSPSTIYLFGEGIPQIIDTLTLAVGEIRAEPGRIIEIPVFVKNLDRSGYSQHIGGFKADLSFNVSMLEPIDNDFESSISENTRTLKLILPSEFDADSVLARVKFKTALGNAEQTKLILSNSAPIGKAKVNLFEQPGVFSLEGLCNEGGIRLLEMDARFSLYQNKPNPVETSSIIEFEAGEPGLYRLFVSDLLGNTVKILLNRNLAKGKYSVTFNAGGLPSGTYYYTLQTPSQIFTRRLEVSR